MEFDFDAIPRAAWLNFWRLKARYHRYEVDGLERLDLGRSALIVGYHGTPIAYDLCMLTFAVYDRFGYVPHAVFHRVFNEYRALRWLLRSVGGVTGDEESLSQVVRCGEHIIVVPGGAREAARTSAHRYQLDWGDRTGYLRLAIKYKLPVVPVACSGVDDVYIGLNNGYSLGKRVGMPGGMPLWFGLGPLGLWPISPPFPAKFRQVVGEPVWATVDGSVDPQDPVAMLSLHHQLRDLVQGLVYRANNMVGVEEYE